MKCHGGECNQKCVEGASKCSLQCDSKNCTQICIKGECTLECHGQYCMQECKQGASNCNLQCGSNHCEQICNKGECTLECHGPNCTQRCNGNQGSCLLRCQNATYPQSRQCEQDCPPDDASCTSTNTTIPKLTTLPVAPRAASPLYHPCEHFCSGEWSNCTSFVPLLLLGLLHVYS